MKLLQLRSTGARIGVTEGRLKKTGKNIRLQESSVEVDNDRVVANDELNFCIKLV